MRGGACRGLGSRYTKMGKLTNREIEVLNLLIEGRSSQELAESLFCSKRTIDFHLANLYHKLGVSNRVQAVRRAMVLGLIDVERRSEVATG